MSTTTEKSKPKATSAEKPLSTRCGIVVIGRNEGDLLRRTIESIPNDHRVTTIYVDSGSKDGSVQLAHSFGVHVHELDPSTPFSPARGRREGVNILLKINPDIEWIQFLDGDCVLEPGWIDHALQALHADPNLGIVCGKIAEAHPESSIYNRMSPLRWDMPIGEIGACGGIFMIRRSVYEEVGGFNAALVTREESDLCERVRTARYRLIRFDEAMAKHDSALYRLSDWWSRAVWGGYGDAVGIRLDPSKPENRVRLRWYLFWPIGLPILTAIGLVLMTWSLWFATLPSVGIVVYAQLFVRTAVARWRDTDSCLEGILVASFWVIRIFACGFGFIRYFLRHSERTKQPNRHARPMTSNS